MISIIQKAGSYCFDKKIESSSQIKETKKTTNITAPIFDILIGVTCLGVTCLGVIFGVNRGQPVLPKITTQVLAQVGVFEIILGASIICIKKELV